MTVLLLTVFVIGYAAIAMEHNLKINKSATALLMCVLCWVIYMLGNPTYFANFHPEEFAHITQGLTSAADISAAVAKHVGGPLILEHMGDVAEILFFLMGAMTIVEIVDINGGFNFVRDRLITTSKRTLLWRIAFLTFFLSAILDNLTTTIVMLMVLRKIVFDKEARWYYAAVVVLAANSGGAFSPIGDVTTIMLWIRGMITTPGVITEVFLPAVVSCMVPVLILHFKLKGNLPAPKTEAVDTDEAGHHAPANLLSNRASKMIFFIGVGGLISVPFFRALTGLPPFMGILLVFSLLWLVTEVFLAGKAHVKGAENIRVTNVIRRIDLSTIMFFLGILMAVAAIQETGTLREIGNWLDETSGGNPFLVTGAIGVLSAIVDNVPLVASCMGMYDIAAEGIFAVDGQFWQLLAYCAGVGGSMLIIGSAAGVVAMGLEKITFGWYLRNITWVAFLGYIGGIITYWLVDMVV